MMFTPQDAEIITQNQFGITGNATRLPGEHDINFRVDGNNGHQYLLKISNAASEDVVRLQNSVIQHMANSKTTFSVPRLQQTVIGAEVGEFNGHQVRLFSFLPGRLLGSLDYQSPSLLKNIGTQLGHLTEQLQSLKSIQAKRYIKWDLQQSEWVKTAASEMTNLEDKSCVEYFVLRFHEHVLPCLSSLRQSVIHGDLNDYNMLVNGDKVTGIIDFGDVVYSATICELAVALAYIMFNKVDPLAAAMTVITAYHAVFPLEERELAILFDLIAMRLCMSVVTSAARKKQEPDNKYLTISEAPAMRLLRQLHAMHPHFAHYCFRAAANYEPCPQTPRVVQWLQQHASQLRAVTMPDVRQQKRFILDFSPGSQDIAAFDHIIQSLNNDGFDVAIGRYNEARLVYSAEQYQLAGDEGGETRTVHLGIDVFLPAGTPVYAPLPAVVFQIADNQIAQDYGPTIILEHTVDDIKFYTLYGHLNRASLTHLQVGVRVQAGDVIGWLGDKSVNGGWSPHLHLQIITDMLDYKDNYPGVAPNSKRQVWLSLSPDANLLTRLSRDELTMNKMDGGDIQALREQCIGKSVKLSYQKPLHIVQGIGQYLYDVDGKQYLDCVNNVCHVGHCHPRVVKAGQQQMAILNTNTRYLHENIVRYAERLIAKLPAPLEVCFFVSSGSEANELALRLAAHYTGRDHWVVMDHGYYGSTSQLINLSPYKFNGPGGKRKPDNVTVVPQLDRRISADHQFTFNPVAALLCEAMPSCGGQVILADGYLNTLYEATRKAGGICIADETQTGLGRLGQYFWGFESQGVIPDIVTLGKPLGNGHPIGVVVTTRAIADAFNNGMEFFSTFGGNPVSAAIGLSVLDVIEEENLQQHARDVGNYLMQALKNLNHPLIVDVRGMGLFIGIELTDHATSIVNHMKDRGILLSVDGPERNVIKFKPPLVFSRKNADTLLLNLRSILYATNSNDD